MKKLFHPGIFAILVFFASSCSKSTDLLNEKSNANALKLASLKWSSQHATGNANANTYYVEESKVYDFINQPYILQLGDPKNSFLSPGNGDFVVFYVIVSEAFMSNPVKAATLAAIDDPSGQTIRTYDLISYQDMSLYPDVEVPAELNGLPYMFAVANLSDFDPYTKNTVSLYSEIYTENGISVARLDQAFIYMP